mmetsp:Transcript_31611/g.28007  ORF Transcript_31611/g.28007 Transcript_31611/m.28007 type:complete len:86 (+) Transcript_31611:622-879(+)
MIGGGTLVGLSNLLLHVNDFSKIQELSKAGDYSAIDTVVGDFEEGSVPNLDKDTIASSFGKIASISVDELTDKKIEQEDVASSLL